MLNGANSRCLSRFTGKDTHAETSPRTRTYDLVGAIRKRRFKWLGHILRLRGKRLIKLAINEKFKQEVEGNMFMDFPSKLGLSFEEISQLTQNRRAWKELSQCLDDKPRMQRRIQF